MRARDVPRLITPQSPFRIPSAQLGPAVSKRADPPVNVNEPGRGQVPRLFSFDPKETQRVGSLRREMVRPGKRGNREMLLRTHEKQSTDAVTVHTSERIEGAG